MREACESFSQSKMFSIKGGLTSTMTSYIPSSIRRKQRRWPGETDQYTQSVTESTGKPNAREQLRTQCTGPGLEYLHVAYLFISPASVLFDCSQFCDMVEGRV